MTDCEIIKALMCCKNADCLNCPRWSEEWQSGECSDFLEIVLDLVNRQKAEIAEYKKHIDQDIIYQKAVEVEAIKGFAEKLKENVTYFEDECGNFVPFVDCRDIEKLLETTGEKT